MFGWLMILEVSGSLCGTFSFVLYTSYLFFNGKVLDWKIAQDAFNKRRDFAFSEAHLRDHKNNCRVLKQKEKTL